MTYVVDDTLWTKRVDKIGTEVLIESFNTKHMIRWS